MKKLLFAFVDADFKVLADYQKLGFKIELDDSINNIYYVEMNLDNNDMLSILAMLDDCKRYNLSVAIQIDDQLFDSEKDYDLIDSMVAANPLLV